MDSSFVFLTRSKGKRIYNYAMEHTDAALQVLDDYMTVSGADPDAVHDACMQLQDTGTYRGIGGLWSLGMVRNEADRDRWYELHKSTAGTDLHYANRVRAERIRAARLLLDLTPGDDDGFHLSDEMLQRLMDDYHRQTVRVAGVDDARADLVTARETINLAVSGADHADLEAAAARIDHALRTLCPHDPQGWYTADHRGRSLTTCNECGVSWYEYEST